MKQITLLFLMFLNVIFINAQVYSFNYQFNLKNFSSDNTLKAKVYAEANKPNKIYEFKFVDNTKSGQMSANSLVVKGDSYNYLLYTKDGKEFFIKDYVQDNYYNLRDNISHINWSFSEETKQYNELKLHKASANFRGRNYTIWYEKNNALQVAPWKFSGISGIVYEAKDDSGNFSWKLESYQKDDVKIINPFDEQIDFVSYEKYPKLRYGFSEEMEKALSMNPNRTMFEQPRVDLEIEFEWED